MACSLFHGTDEYSGISENYAAWHEILRAVENHICLIDESSLLPIIMCLIITFHSLVIELQ